MLDAETQDIMKRELELRVRESHLSNNEVMHVQELVVHPGPRSWKTISLLAFGDSQTGEIHKYRLHAQSWAAKPGGGGYNFERNEFHWHCEGEDEIEAVRQFLNGEFPGAGAYRLVREGSEVGVLLKQLEEGELEGSDVVRMLEIAGSQPDVVAALATSPGAFRVAESVELERRRQQLEELRRIVSDPTSTERGDIHPQLKKMGWVFGGRYVGEGKRKQLTTGDSLDIPLLRADGSLHIVELKAANIPRLVEQYRGTADREVGTGQHEEVPLIVGTDVHRATGQTMSYLVHLDESRDTILARFKIDARRASATVLIGHPDFVQGYSRKEVDETMRIFNSHQTRIEVRHYAELIESAERALALVDDDELGDPDGVTDGAQP